MKSLRLYAVVFTTLMLTAACHPGGEDVDPEAAAETKAHALGAREVRLVTPEVREEYPTLQLVGEVRAFDTVSVSTEVAGKVDRVLVEVGDRVDRGDPLVEVDRDTFQIYLDVAEAELAAARADQALAAKGLERKRDLLSDETIPQAVFDQAQAGHDLAVARASAAEAAHRLAQRNFDRSVIRAPAAGSITKRLVTAGQWAEVGVTLSQLAVGDVVKVAARVPSEWAAKLAGLEGFAFTVGLGTAVHQAKLYSVDPAVQEMSRSFEVVGVAENTDGSLRPGLFANITLAAPNAVRTLWLPVPAVLSSALPEVMLAVDGVVVIRNVQSGRRAEGTIEILDGLDEGEAVISSVVGLSRGLPVRIVGQADNANS
jgi:membrane fusion protein (multidrug efflux system)